MNKFLTKAVLGATLAATALTAAAPADAQRYRRHDDGTGVAIVAGIAGLAIGAAIASSSNRDHRYDRRWDDRRQSYYRDQSYNSYMNNYDYRENYNYNRDDRRGYYDNGYNNNGYRYNGGDYGYRR